MKILNTEFFRAGIFLGLEDVKGPTESFSRQHFCILACQSKTVYGSIASTYRRDTWKLGTTVNIFHNSNFTSLSAQVIPADRKHAGYISTSSSLSSCGKCKGDTWGLAIIDVLSASACWGLTVFKRGVVPIQIWIPGTTLKHQLNVTKALSHREHPRCNPNVNISAAAQALELVCLPRMPAQSPPTQGAFCPFQIHTGGISLYTSRALCLTSYITLQSRVSRQIKGNHNLTNFAAMSSWRNVK